MRYNILLLCLFLGSLFGGTNAVFGTHYSGATMTYECLSANNYRVHHWFYSHCGGPAPTAPTGFSFSGVGGGCTLPTGSGWTLVSAQEVPSLSASMPTNCQGGSYNGIMEWHYSQDFNFTGVTCTQYLLNWTNCCRNPSNTNLSNPGSQGMGLRTDTVDLSLPVCNNSPVWRQPPPHIALMSQTNHFDLGATDADGDQLIYSLRNPKDGSYVNIPYNFGGYGVWTPLGPTWDVDLDIMTGLLSITPTPGSIQNAAFALRVTEYRNGAIIGHVEREFEIITGNSLPCPNTLPALAGPVNPQNADIIGGTVIVSPGETMCFDVYATDADPGNISILTWLDDLTGGTLTDTFGSGPDTVSGIGPWARICWTAPNQMGWVDTATVTVIDTTCQMNNLVVMKVPVLVGASELVWPGDANNDLIADAFDLLPIGLAFGDTGPARTGASNTWVGQSCMPWLDTLAGALDKKFVDCTGDGVINATDTLPISLNYGLTHTKGNLPMTIVTGTNPVFRMVLPDSASVGDTIEAPILLGDNNIPANNIYGYAFALHYDASLIDSSTFWIDFNNSWVGNSSNSLYLYHNHPLIANCDASQVRTSHTTVSGNGEVCRAHFVIIDNIDGKRQALDSAQLDVFFTQVEVIGLNGEAVTVDVLPDSMIIYDRTTEVVLPPVGPAVHVYPNPINEGMALTIEAEGMTLEAVEVLSVQGQLLSQQAVDADHIQVEMGGFAAGLYFVRVKAGGNWAVRRVVVE
jgi:hypothetical protein